MRIKDNIVKTLTKRYALSTENAITAIQFALSSLDERLSPSSGLEADIQKIIEDGGLLDVGDKELEQKYGVR